MKNPLLPLVISTLLCVSWATGSAKASVVLFDDSFESYTLNTTPTNPGDGNPRNWKTQDDMTATVVAGSSPDGLAPNEKVLHLSSEEGGLFSRDFERLVGNAETADTLSLSFKLRIGDFTGSDYRIRLQDNTLATNNIPIYIRIASNGSVFALTRTTGPGTGSATNATNFQGAQLKINTWYEFTIDVNFQAQTYNVTITNMATGTGGSSGNLYFYQNIRSLDQFNINNNTAPALDWYLDDVHAVTTIPEPGTTAALLIGAALAGGLCRFTRKR